MRQVENEANGGVMFGRSEASLKPHRPLARVIFAIAVDRPGHPCRPLFRLVHPPKQTRSGGGTYRGWLPWVILAPALLLVALWGYYPLLRGMVMAFQDYRIVGKSPFVGLDNFITLFLDPSWWVSLWRTALFRPHQYDPGLPRADWTGPALDRGSSGQGFLSHPLFLPQVTSGLVITLLWRQMYDPTPQGFFNQIIITFNHLLGTRIPTQTWLQDPQLAMICCVLPTVWAGMGMSSLIYLAALKGVPEEIYEAAEIDGAGIWHKLTKITLPTIFPLILINFVGAFIGTFQSMGNIFLLTFGGPGDATMVAGMRIWIEAYNNLRFSMATSMAWTLGVLLIAFTYLQVKILQRVEFKKADWK
jgi:ABC-type sugar transport system permease subunit